MNRSTTLILAAGVLTLGTAVAAPLAASASEGAKRVHLVLLETSTAFHFIDAPAADADGQAGDTITFESALTNSGAAAGTLEGHCLQIRADGSLDDCAVTVTLGRNSYRMAGPFDPTTGGTLSILGGAGSFSGAYGTDRIVNQPDGTSVHEIDLVRP